jgi:hypothetical protein
MAVQDPKIIHMPIAKARAKDMVRDILDAGRRSIVTQGSGGRQRITSRQIDTVLRTGWIEQDHVHADEHGNYRFEMVGFCAGAGVRLEVAMEAAPALPRLFVIRAQGDGTED